MFSIGAITVRVSIIGIPIGPPQTVAIGAKFLIEIWNSDPEVWEVELQSRIGRGLLGFHPIAAPPVPVARWRSPIVPIPHLMYPDDPSYRMEVGIVRIPGTATG